MKKGVPKNPLRIIILWSFCCRLLFWWAYDFKVSDCPDTYAFYHLAEKVGKCVQQQFHAINNTKEVHLQSTSSIYKKPKISFDPKAEFIGERSPGYPLIILLCGNSKTLVVALQLVFGVLLSGLLFRLMQRLHFSPKFSFVLPILLPLYLPVFWYETFILVESVALLLVTAIFYFYIPLFREQPISKTSLGLLIGCLGYLVYIKPFYVVVPFLLVLGLIFKNKSIWKNAQRHFLLLFIPVVSYLSWSMVVYFFTGFFVSTTFFGLNKAQNCVYFAEKGPKEYQWLIDPYVRRREEAIRTNQDVSMSIWYAVNAGDYAYKGLRFSELSAAMGEFADQTLLQNPAAYIHQVITRSWWDFWGAFDGKVNSRMQRGTPFFETVYQIELVLNSMMKLLFLGLGIPTLIMALLRKKWDFWAVIVLVIIGISFVQGMVTYGENARFSYPFELIMVLFVVFTCQRIIKRQYHLRIP